MKLSANLRVCILIILIAFILVPLVAYFSFILFGKSFPDGGQTLQFVSSGAAIADAKDRANVVSVFGTQLTPVLGKPKYLTIDESGTKLSVTEVGLDAGGVMQTPKNWFELGWYKKSARAGEEGNIVINGHYDDNYGRPAAFWGLKNLKTGDRVTLIDDLNRSYFYTVSEVFFLGIQDPNRLSILENKMNANSLTLITCGGVWLPNVSTYNQRLVVRALIE